MNQSAAEKRDLERFGCIFKSQRGEFCLDLRGRTGHDASRAKVLAVIGLVETGSGPLVCLAIEVFLFRPRPIYYYFPFDLSDQDHKSFLSELVQHGRFRVRFISGKASLFETEHVIPLQYRERGAVLLQRAMEAFKMRQGSYHHEQAVVTFERWVRVPEFVEYFFSDQDFSEVQVRVSEAVRGAAQEQRESALAIVREVAKSVGPYYDKHGEFLFENLRKARKGMLMLADLRRIFRGNPEGLIQFFGDAIAGSFTPAEVEKLRELVGIGLALTQLRIWTEPEAAQGDLALPNPPPGLLTTVRSLTTGEAISQASMKRLFETLGFDVRTGPGRPTEGYSREYDLKASGLSWSEVTRDALANRPDLAEEFGNRDYDNLNREQQEKLTNRIRQGVAGYVKRTKTLLPPVTPDS